MSVPHFKLVVIESPYRGEVDRNKAYLKLCFLDSIMRGEAPMASHKLYTDVLDDDDPNERKLGIELGFAWLRAADLVALYTDFGMSTGMYECLRLIKNATFRVKFEMRKVDADAIRSIINTGPEAA